MAVRGFKRTHDKPELKGQPAGQMAVVLVEDTVFTLLPTVCPIPMMSQYSSPIYRHHQVRVHQRDHLLPHLQDRHRPVAQVVGDSK